MLPIIPPIFSHSPFRSLYRWCILVCVLPLGLTTHFCYADELDVPYSAPATHIANTPTNQPILNAALEKLHNLSSKAITLTNKASDLAINAMDMLGIRYKYGGNNPQNGLDCSGLVRYLFKETFGTTLPRTSAEISRVGETISPNELKPGDLVFYNTLKRKFSHVGIYLGNNKFIHSPSAGGEVRVEDMDLSYWKKRFDGARRINENQEKH
jgi:cell wall-associated NlpC family hydrolase